MKPSSALVGRTSDRAAIAQRFAERAELGETRLVTVLGPPGIGKSALARAMAAEEGGIVVALGGADDNASACDRIVLACAGSGALGDVAVDDADHAAAVLRELGERLVVLDGVRPALASLVSDLAHRAPEISFLVTARERLAIEGEHVHELGPLDVNGGDAVEVLVTAARRASQTYAPRPEDLPRLVAIARALEGIPLALELAGARLPLVGAMVLAREPPSPLDAVVERTIAELDALDRASLAKLAAFRTGFDASSAAAVLDVDLENAARTIERLRARSLVRTRDAAVARFDLYQPVRSAAERADSPTAADSLERHADFFVREAEAAAARAQVEPSARAWLVAERDELLAIIERVATTNRPSAGDAERALRATVALSSVLLARGPIGAVAAIVSPLVERTRDSGADPRLSARVTALRGAIRRERGDVRGALKDLLAAESIARALSDDLLAAEVLVELGRTVLAAGETAPARDHFDRAARACAVLGARSGEAHATALLGATTGVLGDLAGARAMLERASALSLSDRMARVPILVLLARACAEARDAAAASSSIDEAIALARSENDLRSEGEALVLRGLVAIEANDLDGATNALVGARDLFSAHGLAADAAIARGWLGVVARTRGRAAEAYALLAEARDVCRRSARPAHAVAFGVFLAALDVDVGRVDAARSFHDVLADEAAAGWENASAWPPPARALVEIARGKANASNDPLHVRLLAPASGPASAPPPSDDALVIGERGEWFRPPHGARVGLERRKSLALLLDRLASTPGASVDAPTLFSAAWPGERAIASAAAHRVRVGIATLRKMGLRDSVQTTPTGYSISAIVPIVRV